MFMSRIIAYAPIFLSHSLMERVSLSRQFAQLAKWSSWACGRPATFVTACLLIVVWAATGPLFGFSDTWQLVVNTATTIITFLMVFLIQNTQTRDTVALQIKLDEIIRGLEGAHNALLDLEELDDDELETFRRIYRKLAAQARKNLECGRPDTDTPAATPIRRKTGNAGRSKSR